MSSRIKTTTLDFFQTALATLDPHNPNAEPQPEKALILALAAHADFVAAATHLLSGYLDDLSSAVRSLANHAPTSCPCATKTAAPHEQPNGRRLRHLHT